MITVHDFSDGLITPLLGYAISGLGAFLGLRCIARARACSGRVRRRWLLVAALSIGTTGVWAMNFIAMLGYAIPGQIIHYNVPITIASMLIAVAVVGVGLLIAGFGPASRGTVLLAGGITGIGIASMYYTGMAAMRVAARQTYNPDLLVLSVIIAIAGATAALWVALHLTGARATLGAAMIMGVAVSGMHYTGMWAMHLFPPGPGGIDLAGRGASAEYFLLPLLIGISVLAFLMTATLALSPSDDELRADTALMQRIEDLRDRATYAPTPPTPAPYVPAPRWPGTAVSRATQARRQAEKNGPYSLN